jgi:predicted protein tyrosine phosphatase|tara:strand:- start:267 stop:854 length:588 start_codon:yes stop_codon:yes gene_type:complete
VQNSNPELRICGISTLGGAITQFQPDVIISITDPFSDTAKEAEAVISKHKVPVVALHYHDSYYGYRGAERVSFEMFEEVAQSLDTHAAHDAPKILVHCHAGMQRSPAMAIFALGHIANRTDSLDADRARQIIDSVFLAAPHAEPDARTMDMGADMLEQPWLFREALQARRMENSPPKKRTAKDLRGSKRKRAFRV